MDAYETAMSQFPASSTNNARKIVLEACADFERCPCDRHAQILENYGFSVDHNDRADHAGEWIESNFSGNQE